MEAAPDLSSASDFTRDFAARLFAKRPEWAKMSSVVSENGEDFLRIKILAPEGSDLTNPWSPEHSGCLWLETNANRITIGMDATHRHFMTKSDGEAFVALLEAIDGIVADELLSVANFDGDNRIHSSRFQSRREGTALETAIYPRGQIAKRRVRSWTGRYDRTETLASPKKKID